MIKISTFSKCSINFWIVLTIFKNWFDSSSHFVRLFLTRMSRKFSYKTTNNLIALYTNIKSLFSLLVIFCIRKHYFNKSHLLLYILKLVYSQYSAFAVDLSLEHSNIHFILIHSYQLWKSLYFLQDLITIFSSETINSNRLCCNIIIRVRVKDFRAHGTVQIYFPLFKLVVQFRVMRLSFAPLLTWSILIRRILNYAIRNCFLN